jgi:APA family basic amino acid/polyamine antiporter
VIAVEITFLGTFFASIFALAMGGLIWWMLHPPEALKPLVAKAYRSVDALKRILVPTTGMPYSDRGVELACRLGAMQKADIVLTYVIEVPRTLPLNAPLPEADAKAEEALNRAVEIVQLHELEAVPLVERAREAAEGIIRAAKDNQVDLIVLGMRTDIRGGQAALGRTTESLLRRAPCEVVVDKLPS